MALIALASAKGSPGVTATALALTLTRGVPTVMAECDPSGGSVLAGYLEGRIGADRGILPWALAELRRSGPAAAGVPPEFFGQMADLDPPHRQRLLLPGLTDPVQSNTVGPLWPRFAALFQDLGHGQRAYDVLADCGRLAGANLPLSVLWGADLVLLVVRPSLVSVAAAVPVLNMLRTRLREQTADVSGLGLLVTGRGRYSDAEVRDQLGAPIVARLPHDPRASEVLTEGGDLRLRWPLIQAASGADAAIRAAIVARQRRLPPQALRQGVPGAV